MSNCGHCSIIVKEKDSVNELIKILNNNYCEERKCSFLSFKFYLEEYNCDYYVHSTVQIENIDNYVRFTTDFIRADALCIYLTFRNIDFIYEITDEANGMGGYTNDTTNEFFKPYLCVMFDEIDDVVVDIPIDANDEYINAKIKEIETQYNQDSIHYYTIEYCPHCYYIDDADRESLEKQIEKLLNAEQSCIPVK